MANDLRFIKDVIYGLKREYGEPIQFIREITDLNTSTGLKSITQVLNIRISKAVMLPFSWRKYFADKEKGKIQDIGTQEILIDKKDLNIIPVTGDIIQTSYAKRDIKAVDDYEYSYIVTVLTLRGSPLV
jgi:hypothetical protein